MWLCLLSFSSIIGVVQMVNKKSGVFTASGKCSTLGIACKQADLCEFAKNFGGGAASVSCRDRREEWDEERTGRRLRPARV